MTGSAGSPDAEKVVGRDVTIRFEGHRCIHSRHCVLGQPGVFRANVDGPWIHPDAATAEDVALVAQACPSGAITYARNDGQPGEPLPEVNVLRVRENGPLAFHADLRVTGPDGSVDAAHHRATLCRCGAERSSRSSNCAKPRMAFIGVRSSWLMRERNSLFA